MSQPFRFGIVGGGQLGRMLAQAGAALNARFTFLDPSDSPCGRVHGHHHCHLHLHIRLVAHHHLHLSNFESNSVLQLP